MGESAARRLKQLGYSVAWHSYNMMHAVCPEEVVDLSGWLRERLG